MEEPKFNQAIALFEKKEGYDIEKYISVSLLQRAKGGFSIKLCYEYRHHPVYGKEIIIDNLIIAMNLSYILMSKIEEKKRPNKNRLNFLNNEETKPKKGW